MADTRKALLQRIAQLTAMDVPQDQIAAACGLSVSRISQLASLPEVQQQVKEIISNRIEQFDTLNRGWDAVEEEAISTVIQALRANPDPDYALRAAAVANKASRRGGMAGMATINAQAANATINLKQVFIHKLQQLVTDNSRTFDINTQKRVDILPLQETESLLRNIFTNAGQFEVS